MKTEKFVPALCDILTNDGGAVDTIAWKATRKTDVCGLTNAHRPSTPGMWAEGNHCELNMLSLGADDLAQLQMYV